VKEEKMKKKMKVISPLIALVLLALALPGPTVAHVSNSCRFYGPVTVNGEDVPDGTVVSAWLESSFVGPWTTTTYTSNGASWYVIDIPPDNPSTPGKEGGVVGDQVHFSVSSTPVPGTATWQIYSPSGLLRVYHALSISYVPLTGDVNGDGWVNVLDLILVGQHFGESGPLGWIPEDVNEDGQIDVLDMILIGQHWTG
jgi:hypothetical protein